MNRKKRDKNLIFKVNEDEWNIIQKRLEVCEVSSMSELFRHMMLHGIYLEYDHEELKKIRQSVMSVANNVNQIAHRVNSTSRIYEQDLQEIKAEVNELWQQLQSIQYITNPEKAERVTCYGCRGSAEEISHQFDMLRTYGKNTGSVLSYHIIQSFAPNEATPEQVHKAGFMLCEKLLQGRYKYVLATHTDTEHIHNHIVRPDRA